MERRLFVTHFNHYHYISTDVFGHHHYGMSADVLIT